MKFVSDLLEAGWNKMIGTAKTSESVAPVGRIFDTDGDGIDFFNSLSDLFHSFDESNRTSHNSLFSNDISYIMDSTIESLDSTDGWNKFPNRLNSYFYIYRRIVEYLGYIGDQNERDKYLSQSIKFKTIFYNASVYIFQTTRGSQPNVCIMDRSVLERINIHEHLMQFTSIRNTGDLLIFFVLYKLALQSAVIPEDQADFSWAKILSNVQEINVSMEEMISTFLNYRETLTTFPLDHLAFISLIEKISVIEPNKPVFYTYNSLLQNLNLDIEKFFVDFLPCLPK